MVQKLKDTLDKAFGPPQEIFSLLRMVTTGQTGNRIERLIDKLTKLSENSESLTQALELLRVVKELDDQGGLERMNELLKSLPKGKTGEAMLREVRATLSELGPKLDRFAKVAEALFKEE